jgi:hypothetical protein
LWLPISDPAYSRSIVYLHSITLGPEERAFGTQKWPGNGMDAKPGGHPGEGGPGGDFQSNLNVLASVDTAGGSAGAKVPDYSNPENQESQIQPI